MSYRAEWDLTRTNSDDKTTVKSRKGEFVVTKSDKGWVVKGTIRLATTDNRLVKKDAKKYTIETPAKMATVVGPFEITSKKFNEALESGNQKIGVIPVACSFAQLAEKSAEAERDNEAFAGWLAKDENKESKKDEAGYKKFTTSK